MTTQEQRKAVVDEAMSWVDTPWRHAARFKGVGVDCGQLLLAAFETVGVKDHIAPYRQDWALHNSEELMLAVVERHCRPVVGREPLPGDVALFKFGRCLSHSALVVRWPLVVHAFIFVGKVVVDDVHANSGLVRRYGGCWSLWES
jgi:cell wall-associated NlpC family hydrolase